MSYLLIFFHKMNLRDILWMLWAYNGDLMGFNADVIGIEATGYDSRGNIPIFRKSSHTMFSSYSRPGFWYVTLIGISAQSGGNSWPTANPLNAPPQLSRAVDVELIEGCFDKEVSSFVYKRRTGLSKVTFLKVG